MVGSATPFAQEAGTSAGRRQLDAHAPGILSNICPNPTAPPVFADIAKTSTFVFAFIFIKRNFPQLETSYGKHSEI
jgi:hypothetical protein